jgi:hypothetical protein
VHGILTGFPVDTYNDDMIKIGKIPHNCVFLPSAGHYDNTNTYKQFYNFNYAPTVTLPGVYCGYASCDAFVSTESSGSDYDRFYAFRMLLREENYTTNGGQSMKYWNSTNGLTYIYKGSTIPDMSEKKYIALPVRLFKD